MSRAKTRRIIGGGLEDAYSSRISSRALQLAAKNAYTNDQDRAIQELMKKTTESQNNNSSILVTQLERNELDSHVYYNAILTNPSNNGIIAKFVDSRADPILEKCNDYHLSVVRFTIPGNTIPIMVYPNNFDTATQTYQENKTFYQVCLTYGGTDYPQFLSFTPELKSASTRTPEYYFLFSYQSFIDIINTALSGAFTALKTANPGVASTQAPYFTFDTISGLMSFYSQQTFVSDGIKVFLNGGLSDIMGSFQMNYYNRFQPNGKFGEIVIKDNKNNTPVTPSGYYVMTQNYNTLPLMSSFKSILFTTGMIPVKQEFIPSRESNGATNNLSGDSSQAVITDFVAIPDRDLFTIIEYNPTAEYRMIDLQGSGSLKVIDMNIFWQDQLLNIYPLYIAPQKCIEVKILFRKK